MSTTVTRAPAEAYKGPLSSSAGGQTEQFLVGDRALQPAVAVQAFQRMREFLIRGGSGESLFFCRASRFQASRLWDVAAELVGSLLMDTTRHIVGLLLCQAVHCPQAGNQVIDSNRHDLTIRLARREHSTSLVVSRVTERRHDNTTIDNIEIGIAGGQSVVA